MRVAGGRLLPAVAGDRQSRCPGSGMLHNEVVKFAELKQEALALPDQDRASLAARLLDTLPPAMDVPDEAVGQREQDLDSGRVTAISHEEFVHHVRAQRGR